MALSTPLHGDMITCQDQQRIKSQKPCMMRQIKGARRETWHCEHCRQLRLRELEAEKAVKNDSQKPEVKSIPM